MSALPSRCAGMSSSPRRRRSGCSASTRRPEEARSPASWMRRGSGGQSARCTRRLSSPAATPQDPRGLRRRGVRPTWPTDSAPPEHGRGRRTSRRSLSRAGARGPRCAHRDQLPRPSWRPRDAQPHPVAQRLLVHIQIRPISLSGSARRAGEHGPANAFDGGIRPVGGLWPRKGREPIAAKAEPVPVLPFSKVGRPRSQRCRHVSRREN
jgi:hypothetical protein